MASICQHHHQNNHHFRLFNYFSAASLRRKILATVSCGGSFKPPPKKPNSKPEKPEKPINENRSEKLVDLLNLSGSSLESLKTETTEKEEELQQEQEVVDVEEIERKEKRLEELRVSVGMLQSDERNVRENGAKIVRGFAKEDGEARVTLAMLGAIPPLVVMIDDGDDHDHDGDDDQCGKNCQVEALYALLNLGIGNDLNKAAIVQAGAVHKMLKKIETSNASLDPAISEAIVANFLALSALDSNKPIIGTSGAIPFLATILEDRDKRFTSRARQDALRALYNLSISPSNIASILETGLIPYLVGTLGDMEASERILSILSNVVSTVDGRRAIGRVPDVFQILVDVLNWTDSPGCQEKASYVLMVMAHKSYTDRQAMIEAGIGSALLELTLLGSTLAQKRASRILECLRVDKGKRVSQCFTDSATTAAVSAPICGPSSSSGNVSRGEEDDVMTMMSEERKAVKQLVQQSLQSNMRRIVKRANLPQDFVPSEHLKSLTASSTSKSLTF